MMPSKMPKKASHLFFFLILSAFLALLQSTFHFLLGHSTAAIAYLALSLSMLTAADGVVTRETITQLSQEEDPQDPRSLLRDP